MATKFKKGDAVRQVMPEALEGEVTAIVFNDEDGDFIYKVQTQDGERAFHEDNLEKA